MTQFKFLSAVTAAIILPHLAAAWLVWTLWEDMINERPDL